MSASANLTPPTSPVTRHFQVVDGAIEVLALHGSRGLTFRAIDRQLDAPEGTASNHFANRAEILASVARRLMQTDVDRLRHALEPDAVEPTSPAEVAGRLMTVWSGWPRSWIVARYEIFLESERHPSLREIQKAQGGEVQSIWNGVFRRLGARDLQRSAFPWVDIIRGVLLSKVALSERAMPEEQLKSLLIDQLTFLVGRG